MEKRFGVKCTIYQGKGHRSKNHCKLFRIGLKLWALWFEVMIVLKVEKSKRTKLKALRKLFKVVIITAKSVGKSVVRKMFGL